ncbi:MAG: TetR/AcrR family transcriptional regulator [Pseudomonadota bacterium]
MVDSSPIPIALRPEKSRGHYARTQDTRARILEAALAEAVESGFQKTSVAKIATRAGVAVGVLNYHFGSKRELLQGVMTSQFEDLMSRFDLSPPEEHGDFFEHERTNLLAYLEFLQANPNYIRLVEEVRQHAPEMYQHGIELHVEHFVKRVGYWIERGILREMDEQKIRAQGHFMLGAYLFFDRLIESKPYPGNELVADAFINFIRQGLGSNNKTENT